MTRLKPKHPSPSTALKSTLHLQHWYVHQEGTLPNHNKVYSVYIASRSGLRADLALKAVSPALCALYQHHSSHSCLILLALNSVQQSVKYEQTLYEFARYCCIFQTSKFLPRTAAQARGRISASQLWHSDNLFIIRLDETVPGMLQLVFTDGLGLAAPG